MYARKKEVLQKNGYFFKKKEKFPVLFYRSEAYVKVTGFAIFCRGGIFSARRPFSISGGRYSAPTVSPKGNKGNTCFSF